MRKFIAILLAALLLFGIAARADEPDGFVATKGKIIDKQTYTGTWQQAYLQILNNHSKLIHAYQVRTLEYYLEDRVDYVPCLPVSLVDITSDNVPELIFIEAANEERGDMYIYSRVGKSVKCVLYVPGITRLGANDVDYGFDIYLSSAGSGTLIVEYDEYEWPWTLQLKRNKSSGIYKLQTSLRAKYDNSNESNDRYYKNSSKVSWNTYRTTLNKMRDGRTMSLSTYTMEDSSHYGFTLTWEDAVASLDTAVESTYKKPPSGQTSGGVYGLTIDKLATRTGPGTQYDGGGTYSVKGQYIKVLAKAWDKRNSIWWVKCEIPYRSEIRVLWTGYKRFDHASFNLEDLPEETR